jgi:hypothetical protein
VALVMVIPPVSDPFGQGRHGERLVLRQAQDEVMAHVDAPSTLFRRSER